MFVLLVSIIIVLAAALGLAIYVLAHIKFETRTEVDGPITRTREVATGWTFR